MGKIEGRYGYKDIVNAGSIESRSNLLVEESCRASLRALGFQLSLGLLVVFGGIYAVLQRAKK